MFQKEVSIYFDQCDAGGRIFYGEIFKISHRLIEGFITSKNIAWSEWFDSSTWAVPIKKAETEFFKPLVAGRKYDGFVKVAEPGKSSITFEVTIQDQSVICAQVKSIHVFVNKQTNNKMDIPESIKNKILA